MRPNRAVLLSLVSVLVLAGCQSPGDPVGEADGPVQSVDLAQSLPECGHCGAHEICQNGACVGLPATCPCPKESYCNLAANSCEAGCLSDDHCASGRICDAPSRQCHPGCRTDPECKAGMICDQDACKIGCRTDGVCGAGKICDGILCRVGCRHDPDCGMNQYCDSGTLTCKAGCTADTACPMGQICDNLRCHTGCRNDTGCSAGKICESMMCRTGCRQDMDCGADAMCVKSTLKCQACTADADRGKITNVSTSGRSVSQKATRYLCGTGDVANVTWTQGPPNPGYFRNSDSITVSGATATAVTTIKLTISGTPKTFMLTGNGSQTFWNDSYDFYCFMGMCTGWTHNIQVSSTSDSPVKVELGFYVSATR